MKKNDTPKRFSITAVYISVLIGLLIIFAGYTYYQKNPLKKQWTYDGRYTVLYPERMTVVSYPSDDSLIISVRIPEDVFITVPDGYGFYRVDDVRALGRSEKRGDELLVNSISRLLGIPIETTSQHLSYWEQYRLWRLQQDTEIARLDIDLEEYPVTVEETRGDGSAFERFDESKVDFYFEDTFWERALRDENLTLGVYNASGEPGIAQRASRVFETIGFRVAEIQNWEQELDVCRIQVNPDRVDIVYGSASLARLAQSTHCIVETAEVVNGRFDMQVIVTEEL